MKRAKILPNPPAGRRHFTTVTTHTGFSQRETIEQSMCNLAAALGYDIIYKQENSSGSWFYKIADASFSNFQSASNTILDLSERLAKQKEILQPIETATSVDAS